MPYISAEGHTPEAIRSAVRWFGFSEEQLAKASFAIVRSSSFSDPGKDWNEATLYDEHEKIVAQKFEWGY